MNEDSNPYQSPRPADQTLRDAREARPKRTAGELFWISSAVIVATFLLETVLALSGVGVSLIIVVAGVGVLSIVVSSSLGVARAFRSVEPATVSGARTPSQFDRWVLALGHLAMIGLGMLLTLGGLAVGGRGRQLRARGRTLLPELGRGDGWGGRGIGGPFPVGVPQGVADRWRENARTEHASVAAFARLALDLVALGAPARLVEGAQRDGLDEIEHTRVCLEVARSIDGATVSPAPFPAARERSRRWPSRALALAELAVESLVDGALNEGVSARTLAKLAERCDSEPIRRVVKQLAADEGRHAAHGWDVVAWCLAEGGWVVEKALAGALRALPAEQRADGRPALAASGAWERWGIPSRALEQAEYRAARAHLAARLAELLAEPAVAA